MQLTTNFSLSEFTRSNTANSIGIENSANEYQAVNLKLLCVNCLQPIRNKYGSVRISSGYRSDRLNRTIGGATGSQHKKGQAADIRFRGMCKDSFKWIIENVEFDQIIWEAGDLENPDWIHISYNYLYNRKEVLRMIPNKGYIKY